MIFRSNRKFPITLISTEMTDFFHEKLYKHQCHRSLIDNEICGWLFSL